MIFFLIRKNQPLDAEGAIGGGCILLRLTPIMKCCWGLPPVWGILLRCTFLYCGGIDMKSIDGGTTGGGTENLLFPFTIALPEIIQVYIFFKITFCIGYVLKICLVVDWFEIRQCRSYSFLLRDYTFKKTSNKINISPVKQQYNCSCFYHQCIWTLKFFSN